MLFIKNNFDLAVTSFCFFIFSIALVCGYFHEIGTFGVETDFYGTYAVQAHNILTGKPYTYLHNPPGYPILVAIFSFLTPDLFTAGKIISALSIALIGFINYLIFKILSNEKIAFLSTIFLLITLIPYSFIASTDLPGGAFALIPVLILLSSNKFSIKAFLVIGISCGISYLIRAESIFIIAGIIISVLFVLKNENKKEKIFKTGLIIFGFVLITSPWFIYNWKTNGSPFATTAYLQVGLYFYNEKGLEKEPELKKIIDEEKTSPSILLINPAKLVWKYLKNIPSRFEYLFIETFSFPLYLFLGGGIIFFLINLDSKRLSYIIIWLSGFILLGLISFKLRHYFPLIPLLSFLIFYSILNEKTSNIVSKKSWIILGLSILLILFSIKDAYNKTNDFLKSEPKYLFEISEFLKSHSSKGEIIVSRKPHLAYLSGLKHVFLYENSKEDFYKKAKFINARFIVYSDFEAELWPGLQSLNDPDNLKDMFDLVYYHEPTNTMIYEIK
ncbi:MAG TPA: glycosyltransferase family 39 protein [Ignavibacteriaceae bacterium]|nr:glycosyltransferase family 39 protein [Ignavibacteriaceae bacterium]